MRLPNRPVNVATLDEVVTKLLDILQMVHKRTSINDEQFERLRRESAAIITKEPAVEPEPVPQADGTHASDADVAERQRSFAAEQSMAGAGKLPRSI